MSTTQETKLKSKLKPNPRLNNSNSIIVSENVLYKLKLYSIHGDDTYSDVIDRLINCVDFSKLKEINYQIEHQLSDSATEGFQGPVII